MLELYYLSFEFSAVTSLSHKNNEEVFLRIKIEFVNDLLEYEFEFTRVLFQIRGRLVTLKTRV